MKWKLITAIVVIVTAVRSVVFVDEAEFCIVTQFGRPVRTIAAAGLHFKAPYQSTLRLDRRLQLYDPRPSEFLTKEKKNVNLDVYVCWRVKEPHLFFESVDDAAGAEAAIHDVVWSELAAEIGRNPMEAIIATDPALHDLDRLVGAVATRVRDSARGDYGVEIVDVGLKRINQPEQVRESVFQRMRAERARMARRYRAEGDEEATKIRAEADKKRTVALATAYATAERTRGEAEAEATRIYAEAHQKDPDLFELLRTLEAYKKILDDKTTVLLSADSDLLKYLMRASPGNQNSPEK